MPVITYLWNNYIESPYNSVENIINNHNVLTSIILAFIFTIFFIIVFYYELEQNPPEGILEHIITYVPVTFSTFIIFCKFFFVYQGVTISQISKFKSLFSFFDPIISIYLLILVLCVRSHHSMGFLLFSGWLISICTFIFVSLLDVKKVISDEGAAVSCIIATIISCIFGISVYIYSRNHKNENGKHHRIASTALISYSITIIVFMSLYL